MQDEYCMYLINRIRECDSELLKIANTRQPVSHAYYESYLKMSRINYIKLLSTNCKQNINTKYFKRFNARNTNLDNRTEGFNNTNSPPLSITRPDVELSDSKPVRLRPMAKSFYPKQKDNLIQPPTVDTGLLAQFPANTSPGLIDETIHVSNQIPVNNNQPPPLEDCDDYIEESRYEFSLFTNKKCCHGIYCLGYFGIYDCPYQ